MYTFSETQSCHGLLNVAAPTEAIYNHIFLKSRNENLANRHSKTEENGRIVYSTDLDNLNINKHYE